MRKTNGFSWLGNVAVLVIAIAFFVISWMGFMMGDDLWMNGAVSSMIDLVKHTGWFYLHSGGRLFSVACQYMFSGVLGEHRIWYAVVNTLFFALFIIICSKLVKDERDGFAFRLLLFALLFWFLCPVPKNTLFWIAGSTTYLWANTLSFLFLFLFQKYKDDNFGPKEKLGLFVLSFLAASEYITAAAISGALVVYYVFNFKKLKGNAVPFVVGFIVGSMVLLFAPGSLRRAGFDSKCAAPFDLVDLLQHPLWEMSKYKALWLFLAVFVLGWIKEKDVVKKWTRDNAVLLLSLGWSIIAFSVVFRPVKRALFFPEVLPLVLFLKFIYDHPGVIKNRFAGLSSRFNGPIIRIVAIAALFAVFVADASLAAIETNKQRKNNDASLAEIVGSGGIVALEQMLSAHRMAYAPVYYPHTFDELAKKLDLDTVCVYPYYCLDKYYDQAPPLQNVFVAYDYYADDADEPKDVIVLVIRIEEDRLQAEGGHVVFTIDGDRHGKKLVFEREAPTYCFGGYGYYPFYYSRKDAKYLKEVRCAFM
ncbi:MAG: hypothetical protein J6X40_00590 [Bacteroidales bacterium]|nr:hypothetical protein [Bacteroidales bacterium]